MILQTIHLHHWTQLCIVFGYILFRDYPYKIGTDVMPVPHIITLGFSTIMPVFQYSKTPDLH